MKGWVILWGVSLSIMLVVLAAGTESNAVSYWMEQGNNLFNQGDYPGAVKCYNKVIELGNQTNAPIFTEIVPHCGYYMYAVDKDGRTSKICAEPTSVIKGHPNLSQENLTFGFVVSNPNRMHMMKDNIYVNVTKYSSIANPKIIQNFNKGYTRGYFCNIKPAIGSYKCVLTSKDYDFIDIAPNELEHIAINVYTVTPGTYELRISFDYSIGSEVNTIVVGEGPRMIVFFDNSPTNGAKL